MQNMEDTGNTGDVGAEVINLYQAQSLTVSLRMLERILLDLQDLYSSGGEEDTTQGIMVSLSNPLSQEQRARLEQMTRQARRIIGALSGRFGLNHETADLAREIHGRLVEMWSALEDTRSHKLRRYGAVDPRLATLLDPEMDELIELVLAMDKELFHPSPRPPPTEVASEARFVAVDAEAEEKEEGDREYQ